MEELAKTEHYCAVLRHLVEQHARIKPSNRNIDSVAICDEEKKHYLMMSLGRDQIGRAHHIIIHLRLKEGKVLIEHDGIERGIARELLEAGIPAEDIFFNWSFQPRPLTEALAVSE